MVNTWTMEVLATLINDGFSLQKNGSLVSMSGSIANNRKVTISAPESKLDILDENRVRVCWVDYSREEWPGYFEIDRCIHIQKYVREDRILEWLKHPTI